MPKFVFPVKVEALRAMFQTKEGKEVVRALQGDEDFALSVVRTGWTNKMHHKEKQIEDAELRRMMKEDPDIRKRLEQITKRRAG